MLRNEMRLLAMLGKIVNQSVAASCCDAYIVSAPVDRRKVNLLFLKYFLKKSKQAGMYITVDDTPQCMKYLLKLHKVSLDRLLCLEFLSHLSLDYSIKKNTNDEILTYVYDTDMFHEFSKMGFVPAEIPDQIIETDDLRFILPDNFPLMLKSNSYYDMKKFVEKHTDSVRQFVNIYSPIVVDNTSNRVLLEPIIKNCDRIFRINPNEFSIKQIKALAMPKSKPIESAFSINFSSAKPINC